MKVKYIHKEGRKIIINLFLILAIINYLAWYTFNLNVIATAVISFLSLSLFGFVTWFFRNPSRDVITDENLIIAPADGKVVVMEEVDVDEYFAGKRLQVSIFMSPNKCACKSSSNSRRS